MNVHLVGIGGSGMSALAHLYLEAGDSVSGSDAQASTVTDALGAAGARVAIGHDAGNLEGADTVIVSTAIPDDNPELVEARRRNLRVVSRGKAASEVARGRRQVAVAGTHGKTTTTTMVATALGAMDPLVLSGGRLPGSQYNSRYGRGKVAVIEADESDGSFLELSPELAVVTGVEADHLDHYPDIAAIRRAFELFASRVTGALVACVDDSGAAALVAATPGDVITYGFGPSAQVRAEQYEAVDGGSSFDVSSPWGYEKVRLPVPGRHNASNALAALVVAVKMGRSMAEAVKPLGGLELPGRRLELVAEVDGARVYDDYGHHPTEVVVTLAAARELTPGRLVCAFQPHRYTRLSAMLEDFAGSFGGADELVLVPVYSAGEAPIDGATSEALAAAVARRLPDLPVTVLPSLDDLPADLRRRLKPGDVAVCMGAGDIYRASRRLRDAA
ncbi:MAG TPA: UDP-N-acetylmuramate--L-alanine ligase [Candidatus Dormibacteraeota bacterium]|jgi:UDP-N-acetylmuramate--alanine ligase|nr:UDP-N-acetylmuramate--L-alanine ligase [Candidatus Dormibacteraeota bacterium]